MKAALKPQRYNRGLGTNPAEFAPDMLRIQTMPPRPLPRAVFKLTLIFFVVTVAWAALCRLDVVAVAHGKLVPQTYVKIVQPAEAGIVKEILVNEGDVVREGQVLIRMDRTLAVADLEALRTEFLQKSLALRRIDAELSDRPLVPDSNDPPQLFRETEAQYVANRRALETAIAEEKAAWQRSRQERAAARETEEKLEKILPHYREQGEAYRELMKKGFAGRLMANEKTREVIEKEQDLRAQRFIIAREEAGMMQSERKIAQLEADYLQKLRAERAEVFERVEKLRQELAKQDHRQGLLELKSPQEGVVKDLATHTIGTVAQPGTILMTLVPASESLRGEVWVSNEDVGFIRPDQPVKLKLAAFQFQKYGMVDGRVSYVAADAADSQEESVDASKQTDALVYRALVTLESQQLVADEVPYKLASGMQIAAEIKLGERTVLEYLLSPLQKAFHEAARER
ncbi:HlyD family type I secretion periplasmic adaptor subunit [Methylocaldum sp.]|uniref:HlyD family type I secretion periplasmic adaptor subunit n=1 Tax=Methylocaldum sp. TaxID=1969727 RepID=UPI002D2A3850|nr:HlyD family type I secretion periplasmic adaptor subunit [Methylocaldum sp.]HYE36875.1 HlyD family type I secretion periplasmic adaptor subunit [Methylocaldum sp.]